MAAAKSPHAVSDDADLKALASTWREIKDYLEATRKMLDQEIRNYPTPIPRCDAQFNSLYDLRARLAQDLERMEARGGKGFARKDYVELVEAFINAPAYTDDAAEQAIRVSVQLRLSRIGR